MSGCPWRLDIVGYVSMSAHAGDERLGPYSLREQLGEGGMGVVYLASDPAEQLVAIKVLRQSVAGEETARRRLAHEVATMRRVSSPHVAEVMDADVTGNPPYIVTRYVPGKTLEDVVAADGPLTGAALASLARGLTAALTAMHSAGVVHRDLKPGNVMLVDGEPVVIDFGIAQAADSTRLTMTGMFMGTPGYLAPEVIEGRPSGPAADIHSWGATMAYAVTGRPPFGTGTFEAIFYRIVHGQPDLAAMPVPLVPLVLTALARDPARRPSSAELAQAVAGLDPAALVPGPAADPAQLAMSWADTRTSPDLRGAGVLPAGPAVAAAGLAGAGAGLAGAGAGLAGAGAGLAGAGPAWPGTMPLAARGRDDFADLLPPVQYGRAAELAPAGLGAPGTFAAGQAASWAAPGPGWPSAGPALPGRAPAPPGPAGSSGLPAGAVQAAATPAPARRPLVLATVLVLVGASVLLPVAGTAAVLLLLVGLRSADLTASWLAGRRAGQGPRGSDPAAAAAFFPWAICRSVLRFVLLAPLALLSAAAAAAVAVLAAGPSSLPRAGGWAAGALVACYCLGPGSAACRRPINRFYSRITTSTLSAAAGFIALTALAVVAITAAASLDPGYWPDSILSQHLQTLPLHHPLLNHLPGNLGQVSRQLVSWVGHRL
jgi:Protein kinase domain